MAISNLETIIDNIEQMVESNRSDSHGRILLSKDGLMQLLGELKTSLPREITRFNEKAKELDERRNEILDEAKRSAERLLKEANDRKDKSLDENEQIKIANQRANDILLDANSRAQSIIKKAEDEAITLKEHAVNEYDESLNYIINCLM